MQLYSSQCHSVISDRRIWEFEKASNAAKYLPDFRTPGKLWNNNKTNNFSIQYFSSSVLVIYFTSPVFFNYRINDEISQGKQLLGSLMQAQKCRKYLCFTNQSYTIVKTQKTLKISVKLLKQEVWKIQIITLVIALNLQHVIFGLYFKKQQMTSVSHWRSMPQFTN